MRHRHRQNREHCRRLDWAGHAGLRLSDLQPGQWARIVHVGGYGRARRRFMEMGLVSGETVLVERVAPLGDPVEFLVKGYHLSLRRADARHIEVQMLDRAARGEA